MPRANPRRVAAKADTTRAERARRGVLALLDPRAWAHLLRMVGYWHASHVRPLREARVGRGARISPAASFANGRNVVLGDRVQVGPGDMIWAGPGSARVVVGDDALLGPNVLLTAASYRYRDGAPVARQLMDEADVVVGRDVWIGANAVVLMGVTIGDGAVVAAGAVVRDDVPAGAVVAGNPARVVGERGAAASAAAPEGLRRAGG